MDHDRCNDEEILKPEFVQIVAPLSEVNCWISSFIEEKRKHINLHNVQDFCVAPELRQNCARVDAVLVKRKGTTSHITVKDIKNYCGPQEQIDSPKNFDQQDSLSNKKVFTSEYVEKKLQQLQSHTNFGFESPSSSYNPEQNYFLNENDNSW